MMSPEPPVTMTFLWPDFAGYCYEDYAPPDFLPPDLLYDCSFMICSRSKPLDSSMTGGLFATLMSTMVRDEVDGKVFCCEGTGFCETEVFWTGADT